MTTTTFVGAKGGVGTTTVAVFHALELAERTGSVHLTATAAAGIEDLAAVLGVPAPAPGESRAGRPRPDPRRSSSVTPDHTVVDAGTDLFSDHSGAVLVVTAQRLPVAAPGTQQPPDDRRDRLRQRDAPLLDPSGHRGRPAPPRSSPRSESTPASPAPIDAGLVATSRRHRLAIDLPPDLDYAPIYLRPDADAG